MQGNLFSKDTKEWSHYPYFDGWVLGRAILGKFDKIGLII